MVNFWFSGADNVSESFYLVSEEGALVHLESDARFGYRIEDFVHVTNLFFDCVGVDDHVIYIDDTGLSLEIGSVNVDK